MNGPEIDGPKNSVREALAEVCGGCSFDVAVSLHGRGQSTDVHGERRMPSASLIKIPVALAVCSAIGNGSIRLADRLPVEQNSLFGGTGVLADLSSVREVTTPDLIRLMIAASDNSATNILINMIGFDSVNRWCRDNGLGKTELNRLMMDLEAMNSGTENYTSANDMVRCMRHILPAIGQQDPSDPISVTWHAMLRQQHRNGLPGGQFETEELLVGNKTGSYDRYEHDAAIYSAGKGAVAVAVMTHGAPSKSAAFGLLGQIGAVVRNFSDGKENR